MTGSAGTGAEAVLRVEGLTKRYDTAADHVTATLDASLTVSRGELVLIMGPSGAGKTTFLLLCGGLLRPTSGRIWVGGTEITALGERQLPELRLRQVGFVFQAANLLETLTAVENVRIVLEAAGRRRAEADARSRALLGEVGLAHRLDHRPAQLSGGERQRVAIARAVANRPPLVLADEPTGALDSKTGMSVMGTLRRLVDAGGTSVICVTHDDRIVELADRVLWLEDGRLSESREPAPIAPRSAPTGPDRPRGSLMG